MGKSAIEKFMEWLQGSYKAIIREAVASAVVASGRSAKDAYKATERRLYAHPYMKQKLADDKEMLAELEQYGPRGKSKSVGRFVKSSIRLTPEEIYEAVHLDLEATIDSDTMEVEAVQRALSSIMDDKHAYCVIGRYFEDKEDEAIAEKIGCDVSTVWRNRKRLVQRMAVLLYGADALK